MRARKIPMRKCVACQEMRSKKELLRIVRTPEKEIILDLTGKKSGRGAYVCYNKECINLSKKKRSLERALEVSINEETYHHIENEIDNYNGST